MENTSYSNMTIMQKCTISNIFSVGADKHVVFYCSVTIQNLVTTSSFAFLTHAQLIGADTVFIGADEYTPILVTQTIGLWNS